MNLAELAQQLRPEPQHRRRGRGDTRPAARPRPAGSPPATPAAASAASASALARKASTGRPGSSQRLAPVRPVRTPGRRSRSWPSGVSSRYCGPTSNSAPSAKPRSALRCAAASRLGRIEGRIWSRSALIGLASSSASAPPPKSSRLRLRHEGERHRLDQAARRRACGARTPARRCAGSAPASAARLARQGHRRDVVVAVDAQHLLDEIGLALDIAAPGRRLDRQRPSASRTVQPSAVRMRALLGRRQIEAAQAPRARRAEA